MDGLESVIEQLEAQKEAIDKALAALREVGGVNVVSTPHKTTAGNARSIAQKARWAKQRAGQATAKKTARKGLTAAGRKRLSENMKKRWAAKQSAGRAAKR